MLRDTFVSGLYSTKILQTLLHNASEEKSFNDCVEKAKLIEQVTADAQDIKFEPKSVSTAFKVTSSPATFPPNYKCNRCGAYRKHLTKNCFALKLKCKSCNKTGHLQKVFKSSRTHEIREMDLQIRDPDELHAQDPARRRNFSHGDSSVYTDELSHVHTYDILNLETLLHTHTPSIYL